MISFGVIKRLEEDRAIINTHDDTESSYRILTITGMQYKPRVDDSVMILAPDNNNQSAAVVIPVKAPTGDLEEGDVQLSSEDGGVQIMSDGGDVQITAGGTNRVSIRSENATLLTLLNGLIDDISGITVDIPELPIITSEKTMTPVAMAGTASVTILRQTDIQANKTSLATVLRA